MQGPSKPPGSAQGPAASGKPEKTGPRARVVLPGLGGFR